MEKARPRSPWARWTERWIDRGARARERERRRALRAIGRLARHHLRTDFPWLSQFNDLLSEEYLDANAVHHRPLIEMVEELAAVGTEGRAPRLLEAGSGSSALALHFSRRNYEVTAIDDDPLMVLRARHISNHLGGYARILCMSFDDFDAFRPDAFDVAFSQGTFEHWDNATVHRHLTRQLQVARHVVISTPSIHWPHRDFVNERKMSVDEWKTILAGVDADLLHLGAYRRDQHVLAALRRREA
jgi:2-polyprenyl-3-methyl-5-hydroxy-6-metoxy-1,4-benzoquinol methylase